jgi:hypothetical protein
VEVAERWLGHLLREKWETPASPSATRRTAPLPVDTATRAAVQLARLTGDRARDVGDPVRREVEQRLVSVGAAEEELRPLREVVAVAESERAAFFGDELPLGLRLVE